MTFQRKKIQYFFDIITYDPCVYAMDHPDFIVCSFMENSICLNQEYVFLQVGETGLYHFKLAQSSGP